MNRGASGGDLGWFLEARFGMFVHWGLYALPARHEWVKNREETAPDDYQRYSGHFDPDLYDPREWARAAADAGMRYVVLTTKHHEGFCLWDSALTDYTVDGHPVRQGPGRAVRRGVPRRGAQGRLLPLADRLAPSRLRRRRLPSAARRRATWRAQRGQDATSGIRRVPPRPGPRAADQVRQDRQPLVRLLVRSRHDPESSVLPGKGPDDWGSEELLAMVRELQPGILVNDRLDIPGDFVTPEQYQPAGPMTRRRQAGASGRRARRSTAAGATTATTWTGSRPTCWSGCWSTRSPRTATCCSTSGPTGARRVRPAGARDAARASASGCGCTAGRSTAPAASEFTPPPDARYTQRGDRLYLHLFAWPFRHVHLPGLAGKVEYAQLLNDASEVGLMSLPPGAHGRHDPPGRTAGRHADAQAARPTPGRRGASRGAVPRPGS